MVKYFNCFLLGSHLTFLSESLIKLSHCGKLSTKLSIGFCVSPHVV
jgi:hypothetical protein